MKNTHSGEFSDTSWVSDARGAHLVVRASREGAWLALEMALGNLGIKALKKDSAAGEWLTDWVVWKYDKATGKAQSKPGFSLKKQNLERHRFLIKLKTSGSADQVKIVATDTARQREVDITPDSEYSWLEWKARDSQQEAADSFLQRLQLPIESALATRFVVSGEITRSKDGVAVVADTDSRTSADVVLISIPGAAVAVAPQPPQEVQTPTQPATPAAAIAVPDRGMVTAPPAMKKPVPAPAVEHAARKGVRTPDYSTKPRKNVPTESAVAESTLAQSVPTPAKSVTKAAQPEPDYIDVTPEEPQATAAPKAIQVVTGQAVAAPAAAINGLLVRAAPGVTWPALMQSLKDLDIAIEQSDERQHILLTGWVDANYDIKKQLLVMQSKDKPLWAFSLFGKGVERHRFQLVMVPANNSTQAIIYAYHTGSQEQVDLTPDSEQTLLSWKDRETSPDVALAMLRKLRIVIPH
ncbi:MAG: hypothetical protein WBN90_00695 [Gammaproteobacteria bacterium]